jgi:TrkA domain protein
MTEISETLLPGVGVRHEFTTAGGERLAVLTHRSGRREVAIYDRRDPDSCTTVLHLSPDDVRSVTEIFGGSQVSETVTAVQQEIEGLAIDWVTLQPGSPYARSSIADGAFRTRTGASIVAVIRAGTTVPAPGPEFVFDENDVVVAVGTPEGLADLRSLLAA